MSRLAEAARGTGPHAGLPCSMGEAARHLAETDPASHTHLQAWLDGDRSKIPGGDKEMHACLQTLGYRVSLQTVGRHRRGECRCNPGPVS